MVSSQVCVSACPDVTGIGVRANPVCVDSVDTDQFSVLDGVSGGSITDPNQAAAATVSEGPPLERSVLDRSCLPACRF